jgi:hypothetical protein
MPTDQLQASLPSPRKTSGRGDELPVVPIVAQRELEILKVSEQTWPFGPAPP